VVLAWPDIIRNGVRKNMTQAQIADILGVSQATVSRFMKENGIRPAHDMGPGRGDSKLRADLYPKLEALLSAGKSRTDAAAELRISITTVYNWLRDERRA
jgi:predicted transcriptional regulator